MLLYFFDDYCGDIAINQKAHLISEFVLNVHFNQKLEERPIGH